MSVTMRTNFSGLPAFKRAIQDATKAGVFGAAAQLAGVMKQGMSKGASRTTSSTPGTPPNVQRGQLRGSIKAVPGPGYTAFAGSYGVPYAMIHEFGGTIRPRGKYLKIPVNGMAQRMDENGERPPAVLIKRAGRAPILMGKDRAKRANKKFDVARGDVPVWVLKPSVTMPPRPYLRPAVPKARAAMHKAFVDDANAFLRSKVFTGGAA